MKIPIKKSSCFLIFGAVKINNPINLSKVNRDCEVLTKYSKNVVKLARNRRNRGEGKKVFKKFKD